VAAIEPAGGNRGDEELGAVGVLARVGHAFAVQLIVSYV
jgi:hypothetical protein